MRVVLTPVQAPNANAYAERVCAVRFARVPDQLILSANGAYMQVLKEFVAHYHGERNHQGPGNAVALFALLLPSGVSVGQVFD